MNIAKDIARLTRDIFLTRKSVSNQQIEIDQLVESTTNIESEIATKADATEYFPLTGGDILGDVAIKKNTQDEFGNLSVDGALNVDGTVEIDGATTINNDLDITGSLTVGFYERHIQIPARPSGTVANQMLPVTVGTAGGLQASSVKDTYATFQWEVPDDWNGTDVYFEIDWLPDSGAISGTDALRWVAEYRAIAEGESILNGSAVTVDNGAGGDTGDYAQYITKHTRFTMLALSLGQPLTKQDHVYVLIHRDTAVANDFSGTVAITAFEVIYNSISLPTSN